MRILLFIFLLSSSFAKPLKTVNIKYTATLPEISIYAERYTDTFILETLMELEGFRSLSYPDGVDEYLKTTYSIGYGQPSSFNQTITQEEAFKYILKTYKQCLPILRDRYPLLSKSQLKVLFLTYYNVPFGNNLDYYLKQGDIEGAIPYLLQHNKYLGEPLDGLTKRRILESKLLKKLL